MTREYFYYIDGEGRLFHDASELTDNKFLDFFFKRIQANDTDKHLDNYPYVSPCGKEMNYIRCALSPIVFTKQSNKQLVYGASLTVDINPNGFSVDEDENLYHTSPVGPGRIGSKLLLEWQDQLTNDGKDYLLELPGFGQPIVITAPAIFRE